MRYGLWWHEFVRRLSWSDAADSWNDLFDESQKLSPDPARSSREWKLLLSHLSGPESFRRTLDGNGSITHAEMPFFWKVDHKWCLEGVIDLALFQRSNASVAHTASAARTGKCLILDWKTDRVPPDNTETLQARYRPQLAAYWRAVNAMSKLEVEAAIYSTAAGALVRYDTDELIDEWARLEKLSPEQLDAEIVTEFGSVASASPAPAPSIATKPVQLELL